jgi:simple sugar transport system substrate-binding protein/ribose transport system substrate-binding protein
MCDVGNGTLDASQSQPANLYAYWALNYALDAANGVRHSAGQPTSLTPCFANSAPTRAAPFHDHEDFDIK